SSRRRHTRFSRDWSSDVCSSDLQAPGTGKAYRTRPLAEHRVSQDPKFADLHVGRRVTEPCDANSLRCDGQTVGIEQASRGGDLFLSSKIVSQHPAERLEERDPAIVSPDVLESALAVVMPLVVPLRCMNGLLEHGK